jgi:hypothetical protein
MTSSSHSLAFSVALALLLHHPVASAQAAPAAGPPAPQGEVIPDTAAGRYVGRTVTVEGTIANVKVSRHQGFVFLNFGAPYPSQTISAFIPDSVVARFADVERWAGRRARVTGLIWLQDGKWPALTLLDPALLVEVTVPPAE